MQPPIRIVYLASLRERIGCDSELVHASDGTATVGGLVAWLVARGGSAAGPLGSDRSIRVSVNRRLARADHAVAPGDEVAFFPPFTGG